MMWVKITDKDIVVIYTKEFSIPTEEYDRFNVYIKKVNEDKDTKVFIVPIEVVEKVERLWTKKNLRKSC